MNVYVLVCHSWGGNSYNTEVVECFDSEETAIAVMAGCRGHHKPWEVQYNIVEVPFTRTET